MVDQDRLRVWAARLAAPAAFFAAALVLIWLVQSALSSNSTEDATVPAATAPTTSKKATKTTTTTAGKPKRKRFYRVRSGDTLESIAAKVETTVDDLLRLNPGIDPLELSPGQRLRVS